MDGAKSGAGETTDVGVSTARRNSAGQGLAASRVAQAYNRASPYYDAAPLSFWDRFGAETVDRLALPSGSTVLDVCCGMGASALPAARAVGPRGRVLAVDVAAEPIARGRDRAAAAGLNNIEFLCADATTDLPHQSFDAVICVFGVFFAADIPAFIGELWSHVRPGGQLAITTWGPDLFEPANTVFWEAVAAEDHHGFNPWDDITTPQDVRQAMDTGGVDNPHAVAVPGVHHLVEPDDFWQIVLGSGYRATIDALPSPVTDQLSCTVVDHLRARMVTELTTNVVYATATRHAPRAPTRLSAAAAAVVPVPVRNRRCLLTDRRRRLPVAAQVGLRAGGRCHQRANPEHQLAAQTNRAGASVAGSSATSGSGELPMTMAAPRAASAGADSIPEPPWPAKK